MSEFGRWTVNPAGRAPSPGDGAFRSGIGQVRRRPDSVPAYGRATRLETPQDLRDAGLQYRLFSESLGTQNLAGNAEIAARARNVVRECIESTNSSLEYLRNKWLVLYRLYRGETMATFQYGRAAVHSPEPFKAVETLHPRIYRTLFGSDPWFLIHGEEHRDAVAAKQQQALCRAQLLEMDYDAMASEMLRDFLIYGTCVQKLWWKQTSAMQHYRRATRVPDPDRPGTTVTRLSEVKREEIVYDGNYARSVSLFDFYAPPTVSSLDDADWCADRSLVPSYEVIANGESGIWLNLEELSDQPGIDAADFGDEWKQRKAYSYGIFDQERANAPHLDHYVAIDWWGWADIHGDRKPVFCNIVILNPEQRQTVAVVREMPFWHQKKPYQLARYIALKDELFGIGVIEPIARLSMELDMKRNLSLAAAQLTANPMLKVGPGANVPDGQLTAQPGLVLRCDDVSEIEPLFMPAVSDEAVKAEMLLRNDLRETTGVTGPLMGQSDAGTATEFTGEVNEGNMRVLGAIQNLEREVLRPMLYQMTWNNQQFLSRQRVINVLGGFGLSYQDRYTIRPEQLGGKFLFQPMASLQLSTHRVQTQQLINLIDRAPAINQIAGPNTIKIKRLLGKVFRDGFGFRDAADFIGLDPKDAGVLTPTEEHEMWYHGEVPPVRDEDNHLRHYIQHAQEIETDAFRELSEREPYIADQARAHQANHAIELERMNIEMEQVLMLAAQQGAIQEASAGGGGGEGGTGFAGAGQQPGSPGFRGTSGPESGMPKNENGATKSEAGMAAPNEGAS